MPGVLVSLYYSEGQWLGPQLSRKKAEGKTDAKGNYQLFFDLKEDELIKNITDDPVYRSFMLIADLQQLDKDNYLLPSDSKLEESSTELRFPYYNTDFQKGKTYNQDLYIPHKRWIDCKVSNQIPLGNKDKFAIINQLRYGGGQTLFYNPINLTNEKEQTFRIPVALNDTNRITLACLKGGSGSYDPITDIQKVYISEKGPQSLSFSNDMLANEFKFRLKSQSAKLAPFNTACYEITDWEGKSLSVIPGHPVQFYDSIVWSAKGYPDHLLVYCKKDANKYVFENRWETMFFQKEPLYTYLSGYRDGKVVHVDSLQTNISPRDFLCYNWNDEFIKYDQPDFECHCILYKDVAYHYYVPSEKDGHLFSKVTLLRGPEEKENSAYYERCRNLLSGLMNYHLGSQQSFDSKNIANRFHCLPEGAKVTAYWQTEATRAALVEVTDNAGLEIIVHAEPSR